MTSLIEILKIIPIPFLYTLSIVGVLVGDVCGKQWAVSGQNSFLLYAILGSLTSGLFYYPILLKQGLVVSSIVWTILSIIAFLLIGIAMYHETLTASRIIGSVLGVVAIFILSF